MKGDTSFLETDTTDDYTIITGSGAVLTKSQAIQMRKSGDVKYTGIDVSDQKVRVYGNTVYNAVSRAEESFIESLAVG